MNEVIIMAQRGGKREGAGRKKSLIPKNRHMIYATDGQWNIISMLLQRFKQIEKEQRISDDTYWKNFDLSGISANNVVDAVEKTTTSTLTKVQQEALDAMESGKNVFLTGGAGTGKSFVLQQFIKQHDGEIVITAPTGIAAQNIHGSTLHRTFKIPIKGSAAPFEIIQSTKNSRFRIARTTFKDYINRLKTKDVLKKCKILVIDEISMVRADIFEFVMSVIQGIETYYKKSIQVIVCGDFCQLAPVITSREKTAWLTQYPQNPEGFAFLTDTWKTMKFTSCYLTEVVRQKDRGFSTALNDLRLGDPSGTGSAWIQAHTSHAPVKDGIYLCATKKEAASINSRKLYAIKGRLYTYQAELEGNITEKDVQSVDIKIEVKVGVRVMLLINDIENQRFSNGSFGEVVHIAETYDEIKVKLDDTGEIVPIKPVTFEVTEPVVTHEDGNVKIKQRSIGSYTQFPLRPAWATTIHKTQGMSLEKVNVKSGRIFSDGQAYVALSRAMTADMLYIDEPLTPDIVRVSESVIQFYKGL